MNISLISFIVALVVITFLIVLLMKQKSKPQRKEYRVESSATSQAQQQGLNVGLVQSKWAEIVAMQNSGPSGLKSALSEADKLLDYCMIGKGFAGETMGDRLKSGGSQFSDLNGVWAAHKLRNQFAHEVEHDIVPEQVKHSIHIIGGAIQELGVTLR